MWVNHFSKALTTCTVYLSTRLPIRPDQTCWTCWLAHGRNIRFPCSHLHSVCSQLSKLPTRSLEGFTNVCTSGGRPLQDNVKCGHKPLVPIRKTFPQICDNTAAIQHDISWYVADILWHILQEKVTVLNFSQNLFKYIQESSTRVSGYRTMGFRKDGRFATSKTDSK